MALARRRCYDFARPLCYASYERLRAEGHSRLGGFRRGPTSHAFINFPHATAKRGGLMYFPRQAGCDGADRGGGVSGDVARLQDSL